MANLSNKSRQTLSRLANGYLYHVSPGLGRGRRTAVTDDSKSRFDLSKKRQRCSEIPPVAEECHRFTNHVPGRPEDGRHSLGLDKDPLGCCIICVSWIKTSVEERRVAEQLRRQRSHLVLGREL